MESNFIESFEKLRAAGSVASGALDEVCKIIKPGISTNQIDNLFLKKIYSHQIVLHA